MSAPRSISGAAGRESSEGWTSEFDRVFRLPARIRNAKTNGYSTSHQSNGAASGGRAATRISNRPRQFWREGRRA
jgi:hypothetical protein